MVSRGLILASVLALLLASSSSFAAIVGTASIVAPAVVTGSGAGSLTQINLTVTNGTGNVTITGVQSVGNDTVQSAITAAVYASQYTGSNFDSYDFNYTINTGSSNVTGPSAGAAMTLLAVSALSHQQFRPNFTITGTISPSGAIGEVGGVYDKVEASSQNGYKFVLVPAVSGSNPEDMLYALIQADFGLPLVQVTNITQAARFAFNPTANYTASRTTYNPYVDYQTGSLAAATLQCSNSCNTTAFGSLVAQTFNFTKSEISQLASIPRFSNISSQLS
ncbi:MAG: S16 family serine protease, partial [Candidatus Micrarchaeaceae archaeon]